MRLRTPPPPGPARPRVVLGLSSMLAFDWPRHKPRSYREFSNKTCVEVISEAEHAAHKKRAAGVWTAEARERG